MTKLDKEIRAQLFDPRGKGKGKRLTWSQFMKAHSSWTLPCGKPDIQRIRAHWDEYLKGRAYDPAKKHGIERIPKRWFYSMLKGIQKRSDVRDPAAVVGSIWKRLSPAKRAEIKQREARGEHFAYDLPLPVDYRTKGAGTLRTVKPFNLVEVQANVTPADYISALKSRLFSQMKRGDGTTALVARCKAPTKSGKNVNIFIDKYR